MVQRIGGEVIEDSGGAYEQLLARLREALPDVARQVDEEVQRGRRVAGKGLSPSDRTDRNVKLREAGSKISATDLAQVEYTGEERLQLLIDAVRRLGSSMASNREAVLQLLVEKGAPTTVEFRPEEEPAPESRVDLALEATKARAEVAPHLSALDEALAELR